MSIPRDVEAVFREFRTCEFSTLAGDGTPITWPTVILYRPDQDRFLTSSSIALAQKVFNIRRNSRVALLFSNPTGSGLVSPPAVLVQGDATAPDKILTSAAGLEDYYLTLFKRQPASEMPDNAVIHKLIDWYYMRILIWVQPKVIRWWPAGDFSQQVNILEVPHVERAG